jgi:2-isopropylmalate synthase
MVDTTVVVFDTTLRDGEQAPGFSMHIEEKLRLARQLDELNVDIIEAGFPIASEADAESVRRVALEVRRPTIAALARCVAADIDCAGNALKPAARSRIHTFIATSDLHLERKLRITREQCLETAVNSVKRARQFTDDVQFSAEDATRSDMDFLRRVVEAVIAAGATTINLPDTVGYCTPDEITEFFTRVLSSVPNASKAVFSTHCHDDLGLAVANSIAAVRAGVRQVECTINGIGERAGNASLEEVVMIANVRPERAGFKTAIKTPQLFPTSQLLTQLTGEAVQANKAIVGRNAFAHESGIHQDGMLKDRRTYEIMNPEDVGVPKTTLVLGKHSGRHAIQKRCEDLGFALSKLEVDRVYRRVIHLADHQKHISDAELISVIEEVKETAVTPPIASTPASASTAPAAQAQAHAPANGGNGTAAAPPIEVGYGHGV